MQSGYTKSYCRCEWDSRGKNKHYKMKAWPMRENSALGGKLCQKSTASCQRKAFGIATTH
jgi:hypothetical protein